MSGGEMNPAAGLILSLLVAWTVSFGAWFDRDWRGRLTVVVVAAFAVLFGSAAWADNSWINWGGYKSPIDGTRCCGVNDCFVVPAAQVKVTSEGYLLQNGELVPYMEAQPSEDQEYWRCKRYDGSRRCFFAPQPGS